MMWKLKDEAEGGTAAQNAEKMKVMLEALKNKIEVLKEIEVSTDVFDSSPECSVVLYSVVETRADLDAYQVHPEHQACITFIKKVVAERRAVDYEI